MAEHKAASGSQAGWKADLDASSAGRGSRPIIVAAYFLISNLPCKPRFHRFLLLTEIVQLDISSDWTALVNREDGLITCCKATIFALINTYFEVWNGFHTDGGRRTKAEIFSPSS